MTSLKAVEDFPTSVAGWYFDRIIDDPVLSPADFGAAIQSLTRKDIVAVANAVKLDTVYVLKGSE